jgi:hypothetical protein
MRQPARLSVGFVLVLALTACSATAPQPPAPPVPDGVDPAVWSQLTERYAAEVARVVSAEQPRRLPPDELCRIEDLQLTPQVGGYLLEWNLRNPADYNQDGEVNVSDLATLGRFLNVGSSSEQWPEARFADGNNDGVVTINDITPLAENLRHTISGYVFYVEMGDLNGDALVTINDLTPWAATLLGTLPVSGAPDIGNPLTQVQLAGTPNGTWIGMWRISVSSGQKIQGARHFSFTGILRDLPGFSLRVAPAFDDGTRDNRGNWLLDDARVGPASDPVVMPGWLTP